VCLAFGCLSFEFFLRLRLFYAIKVLLTYFAYLDDVERQEAIEMRRKMTAAAAATDAAADDDNSAG